MSRIREVGRPVRGRARLQHMSGSRHREPPAGALCAWGRDRRSSRRSAGRPPGPGWPKSRHTSLISLAVYAQLTFDAVAAATAALDPRPPALTSSHSRATSPDASRASHGLLRSPREPGRPALPYGASDSIY